MILLISVSKAQKIIPEHIRALRLNKGLTQEGLSKRSGVSLATLRKFEQQGQISLESFLKIAMVLECLEKIVKSLEQTAEQFSSMDEVLRDKNKNSKRTQRGWLK